MKTNAETVNRFVGQLERLCKDKDRATLARLRRGLGKPPGYAAERDGWVLGRLPDNVPARIEANFCLAASLFSLHPDSGGRGGLGAALRQLKERGGGDGPERRFVALLNSDEEDLPGRLRHAISLLKSKTIPVDWRQLLLDLLRWGRTDRPVQRQWSREFWTGQDSVEPRSSEIDAPEPPPVERTV